MFIKTKKFFKFNSCTYIQVSNISSMQTLKDEGISVISLTMNSGEVFEKRFVSEISCKTFLEELFELINLN